MYRCVKVYGVKFEINNENAGYDIKSIEKIIVPANGRVLAKCDVKTSFPQNMVAMVCPRSGLALKEGITVLNSPGIIDASYRGFYGVILHNTTNKDYQIEIDNKIAQIVFIPVIHPNFVYVDSTDQLDDSSRKDAGFGSTGK
jgi:dUTP pyrophosphatase